MRVPLYWGSTVMFQGISGKATPPVESRDLVTSLYQTSFLPETLRGQCSQGDKEVESEYHSGCLCEVTHP